MMWIIITESLVLLLAIALIIDRHYAIKTLIAMYANVQNELWIRDLKDSGCEIIEVSEEEMKKIL